MHIADIPLLFSSAIADKPAEPAPITTTSGLDCAKEIPGKVANANPDIDFFRNCLLPILFINIFFKNKRYQKIQ